MPPEKNIYVNKNVIVINIIFRDGERSPTSLQ